MKTFYHIACWVWCVAGMMYWTFRNDYIALLICTLISTLYILMAQIEEKTERK